jgi:hypothetical protein
MFLIAYRLNYIQNNNSDDGSASIIRRQWDRYPAKVGPLERAKLDPRIPKCCVLEIYLNRWTVTAIK